MHLTSSFALRVRGAVLIFHRRLPVFAAARPCVSALPAADRRLSPYSDEYGGAVLNATIDRFAFAFIEPSPQDWRIRSYPSTVEWRRHFRSIWMRLAARSSSCMLRFIVDGSRLWRRSSACDDRSHPRRCASWIGFGSSSALVVALVEAFRAMLDVPLGPYEIAHFAFEIERIELGLSAAAGSITPRRSVGKLHRFPS